MNTRAVTLLVALLLSTIGQAALIAKGNSCSVSDSKCVQFAQSCCCENETGVSSSACHCESVPRVPSQPQVPVPATSRTLDLVPQLTQSESSITLVLPRASIRKCGLSLDALRLVAPQKASRSVLFCTFLI